MTFWQLVRDRGADDLTYVLRPYITIYPDMVEINRYDVEAT